MRLSRSLLPIVAALGIALAAATPARAQGMDTILQVLVDVLAATAQGEDDDYRAQREYEAELDFIDDERRILAAGVERIVDQPFRPHDGSPGILTSLKVPVRDDHGTRELCRGIGFHNRSSRAHWDALRYRHRTLRPAGCRPAVRPIRVDAEYTEEGLGGRPDPGRSGPPY